MSTTRSTVIVIDSSVGVKWVNGQDEQHIDKANKLIEDAQKNNITLVMPELSKYEICNALLYKKLDISSLQTSIDDFYHLPIRFIPEDLETAIMAAQIATEIKITYYDATFLALAIKLKARLVTSNQKHQKKYHGKDVVVIPLNMYEGN